MKNQTLAGVWVTTLATSPVDDEQLGLIMSPPSDSAEGALVQLRLGAAESGCAAVVDVTFVVMTAHNMNDAGSQVVGYGTAMRRRPVDG